jgi:hypothetical protein
MIVFERRDAGGEHSGLRVSGRDDEQQDERWRGENAYLFGRLEPTPVPAFLKIWAIEYLVLDTGECRNFHPL